MATHTITAVTRLADRKAAARRTEARAAVADLTLDSSVQLLRALADGNRLRIINLLLNREELCVCDIERVLDMTQTKVSRHLTILRNAGLVNARREGRWMYYSLREDSDFKQILISALRSTGCRVPACLEDLAALDSGTATCSVDGGCI